MPPSHLGLNWPGFSWQVLARGSGTRLVVVVVVVVVENHTKREREVRGLAFRRAPVGTLLLAHSRARGRSIVVVREPTAIALGVAPILLRSWRLGSALATESSRNAAHLTGAKRMRMAIRFDTRREGEGEGERRPPPSPPPARAKVRGRARGRARGKARGRCTVCTQRLALLSLFL